ncbi:hypothetical protein ACLOJK_004128, partial [Asimina triloba]
QFSDNPGCLTRWPTQNHSSNMGITISLHMQLGYIFNTSRPAASMLTPMASTIATTRFSVAKIQQLQPKVKHQRPWHHHQAANRPYNSSRLKSGSGNTPSSNPNHKISSNSWGFCNPTTGAAA